jgi:hypothetical protein
LQRQGQSIQFSGVGAHHQNGLAEGYIRIVVEMARTMMQHAALHWPAEFEEELWPFAMDCAGWIWNNMPQREGGLTPFELLSGVAGGSGNLNQARVWGFPTYVLDPKLQDGKKIPKWKARARRGQFLGMSTAHASTVGLIRNLVTQYVSPQFHVVYDELFQSIANSGTDDADPLDATLSHRPRSLP